MASSPDLLHGLLDDNLAALLDDMVGRDSQLSATQLPTTSDALSFRDFLPIYNGSASEQPSPQEPTFDPGLHYEDHNNDNHASQKRSGSG
jgi:hypothetical protein